MLHLNGFKLIAILTTVLLLCLGCSSFDRYMNSAKEYMVKEDYDKAIGQLNLALIENPTNKDAEALLKNAELKKKEKDELAVINKFITESEQILNFLNSDILVIDPGLITIEEAQEILPKALEMQNKTNDLIREFSFYEDKEFTSTYNSLLTASDAAVTLLNNIIENVIEELPPEENLSYREKIRNRLNSNDSRIKASYNKIEIENNIQISMDHLANVKKRTK